MTWETDDVKLVPIHELLPHEETKTKNQQKLHQMTIKWGGYNKPLLVDANSKVILDGHHRFRIGEKLGLKYLPAILIDYLVDERIQVMTWPNAKPESITKEEVIQMGLSNDLFPPKTSKHVFFGDLPPIFYSIEDLS
tara:strand:- start:274 stop:684 length:411 start_codon:yes stop_codon:yes gene_type:complete